MKYEFRPLIKQGEHLEGYATELHAHVKGTSSCAWVDAPEMMELYRAYNYTTIVSTNHFGPWGEMTTGISGKDAVKLLEENYLYTAAVGKRHGITVLPGVEISFYAHHGDYLLYGFDWDFFYEHPLANKQMTVTEFARLAHKQGYLIYQAHPFRDGPTPEDTACLDGVEVFNGQSKHDNRNPQAYRLAKKEHLKMISGSDFHQNFAPAKGGIITPEPITTVEKLMNALWTDDYALLYEEEYLSL